ncbi:hypothetical protein [Propionibacterium freudenreichii]
MEQPASGQGHDEALTRLAPTTPERAMLLESGRQALTLIGLITIHGVVGV